MAMVIHPRDEKEKRMTEIFYDLLKALGISKVGYAGKDLKIEKNAYSINVERGDLIAVANTPEEKDRLSAAYGIYNVTKKFAQENSINIVPEATYIDATTIALAKLLHREGSAVC